MDAHGAKLGKGSQAEVQYARSKSNESHKGVAPCKTSARPEYHRSDSHPSSSRKSTTQAIHHNIIYQTTDSSSPDSSPTKGRKSFPSKTEGSKTCHPVTFAPRRFINIATSAKSSTTKESKPSNKAAKSREKTPDNRSSDESNYGFTPKLRPPVEFSTFHELSEAECDLELRRQALRHDGKAGPVAQRMPQGPTGSVAPPPQMLGQHPGSQFRSYVGHHRPNKDYSINV
ncbi:unnamed protein product [Meganyctiphanes norvegica]|uniref:Uncharacterized protein n=1 Tax=Meganyctiphanes norvegica TaxID=48144 RepID=A0AAV2SSM8_MEGNR